MWLHIKVMEISVIVVADIHREEEVQDLEEVEVEAGLQIENSIVSCVALCG